MGKLFFEPKEALREEGEAMTDNRTTEGVCITCRFYKRNRHGRYCEYGVTDRERGRNLPPCGWWEARKR